MKKTVLFFIFGLWLLAAQSQSQTLQITPDARLYERYSAEKIQSVLEKAPAKILELNSQVLNKCYISNEYPINNQMMGDIADVQSEDYRLNVQKIVSEKQINPLMFGFQTDMEKYNVYTIGNTGYYVIVYPFPVFLEKQTAYLAQFPNIK